jgi:hypothetical protein
VLRGVAWLPQPHPMSKANLWLQLAIKVRFEGNQTTNVLLLSIPLII